MSNAVVLHSSVAVRTAESGLHNTPSAQADAPAAPSDTYETAKASSATASTPVPPRRPLPEALAHPEFICPASGDLLTDPVIDIHGQSYQRGSAVGGPSSQGPGVNIESLDGPVLDDVPTRKFVADALSEHPEAQDAFLCTFLNDLPAQPVMWHAEGLTEQRVFDAAQSKAFFASGAMRSPNTRDALPAKITLRQHRVAAAYVARVTGKPGGPYPTEEVVERPVPPLNMAMQAMGLRSVAHDAPLTVWGMIGIPMSAAVVSGVVGLLGGAFVGLFHPENEHLIVVAGATAGAATGLLLGAAGVVAIARRSSRNAAASRADANAV